MSRSAEASFTTTGSTVLFRDGGIVSVCCSYGVYQEDEMIADMRVWCLHATFPSQIRDAKIDPQYGDIILGQFGKIVVSDRTPNQVTFLSQGKTKTVQMATWKFGHPRNIFVCTD